MQRVIVTENGMKFRSDLLKEQKQHANLLVHNNDSNINHTQNNLSQIKVFNTEVLEDSQIKLINELSSLTTNDRHSHHLISKDSQDHIRKYLIDQIGSDKINTYLSHKINQNSRKILQNKKVYQKQFKEQRLFLEDVDQTIHNRQNSLNHNQSLSLIEYSIDPTVNDAMNRLNKLNLFEGRIKNILQKYHVQQQKQNKLFQQISLVNQKKQQKRLDNLTVMNTEPYNQHVNRAGFKTDPDQDLFGYRYLLQEKHNQKYVKQWKNNYIPENNWKNIQSASDAQLKIQYRKQQDLATKINEMDRTNIYKHKSLYTFQ